MVAALVASGFLMATPQRALASQHARATHRDCSDFDNQTQAQKHFVDRGGRTATPTARRRR
jgi:hypothetical protein